MTDAVYVFAFVAGCLLVYLAWRKWGRLGALGAVAGILAFILAAWRRARGAPREPVELPIDEEVQRQALAAIEAKRAEAAAVAVDAMEAREAAERIAADVDTAGDAEKLVAHVIGRSEGRS